MVDPPDTRSLLFLWKISSCNPLLLRTQSQSDRTKRPLRWSAQWTHTVLFRDRLDGEPTVDSCSTQSLHTSCVINHLFFFGQLSVAPSLPLVTQGEGWPFAIILRTSSRQFYTKLLTVSSACLYLGGGPKSRDTMTPWYGQPFLAKQTPLHNYARERTQCQSSKIVLIKSGIKGKDSIVYESPKHHLRMSEGQWIHNKHLI